MATKTKFIIIAAALLAPGWLTARPPPQKPKLRCNNSGICTLQLDDAVAMGKGRTTITIDRDPGCGKGGSGRKKG